MLIDVKYFMDFQLNHAKSYYKQGLFSHFEVVSSQDGWVVKLFFKDTNLTAAHIVDARSHKVRFHKSIDGAVEMAKQIGFTCEVLTSR